MSFVRMLRAKPSRLLAIRNHPFNKMLIQGTLPRDTFRFFINQDSLYLRDFSMALRQAANRLDHPRHRHQFQHFSDEVIDTERNLHKKYLGHYQPNLFTQPQSFEKIPAVASYTSFILKTAHHAPIEEAVASLIPCFWIYNELGRMMREANINQTHPYYTWLTSYSNPQFTAATQSIIQISDELSGETKCPIQRENMHSAFDKSVDYEVKFWDSVVDVERSHHYQIRKASI